MVKFGKETSPLHVICYAHAIQLAICDVLYKRQPSAALNDDLDSEIGDTEEEGTDDENQAEEVDRAKNYLLNPEKSKNYKSEIRGNPYPGIVQIGPKFTTLLASCLHSSGGIIDSIVAPSIKAEKLTGKT